MIEGAILPVLLALVIFGVGLAMRPRALICGTISGRSLLVGLIGAGLVLPAGGLVIVDLAAPDPALRTGLMLLAISPVGLLAGPLTGHARGNVALAVALTIIVSLEYIVLAPLLIAATTATGGGMDAAIRVPADLLFGKIVLITVVPMLAGTALHARHPHLAARLSGSIDRATGPTLVTVLAWIAFDNRAILLRAPLQLLATVAAINVLSIVVAVALGRVGRLDRPDRTALLFAHLMRQEGTGIFIAVSLLATPSAAVPLIANTVIGLTLCGAIWVVRASRKRSQTLRTPRPRRSVHLA